MYGVHYLLEHVLNVHIRLGILWGGIARGEKTGEGHFVGGGYGGSKKGEPCSVRVL